MRVLVLGGCGFIGSHVAEQLVANGHDIAIFARPNVDRRNVESIQRRVRFVNGDFQNSKDVRDAVRGVDAVIHAVGSTLPANSLENPAYDIQSNVVASVNLLSACVAAKVRRVVFISSGGTVYGIPKSEFISEDHPLDPINPYGLSKLAVEKFLGVFLHQYGLDYRILRLANPYGSRQREGSGHVKARDDLAGTANFDLVAKASTHQARMNKGQAITQGHADIVDEFGGGSPRAALFAINHDEIWRDVQFDHGLDDAEEFVAVTDAKFEASGLAARKLSHPIGGRDPPYDVRRRGKAPHPA